MKNLRDSLKPIALTALLTLSVGLSSSRDTVTAQENGNNAEEFIFGTVGITESQTARLNIVNTATDGRAQTRMLKFLDAAGNVIVDSSGHRAQITATLAPGESAYLDLNGADISGTGRVQIRALDPTDCGRSCSQSPFSIIQTLELIDNVTLQTEVLYDPAQFTPPGQGLTGPFGMAGIVGGQTARLSVTVPPDPIAPSDPFRVLVGFAKSNGQPVLNADGVPMQTVLTVHPGESASFDLSAHFFLGPGEIRAEIRPVVAPEGPTQRIIPTLEIIDDTTGKTVVLYAPAKRICATN